MPTEIFVGIDPLLDPCGMARELRNTMLKHAVNGRIQTISFSAGNGSSRSTTWQFGSLKDLRDLLLYYENQCRLLSGGAAYHHGLRAGGM